MAVKLGNVLQLKEFQSLELVNYTTLGPETYFRNMDAFGNSILSSVFVKEMDPGTTILVKYWDTSSGIQHGERYELGEHILITPDMLDPVYGFTHRITVTRIHNKPNVEIIITGGNVSFGVYGTIVSTSASDMDQALRSDGQDADFTRDKGLAPVLYDAAEDKWYFTRGDHGVQIIKTSNQPVGAAVYLQSADGLMTDEDEWVEAIVDEVPLDTVRYLQQVRVVSTMDCEVRVTADGAKVKTGRVGPTSPNCEINWNPPRAFPAGVELKVEVRARDNSLPRLVEAYLDAVDESV